MCIVARRQETGLEDNCEAPRLLNAPHHFVPAIWEIFRLPSQHNFSFSPRLLRDIKNLTRTSTLHCHAPLGPHTHKPLITILLYYIKFRHRTTPKKHMSQTSIHHTNAKITMSPMKNVRAISRLHNVKRVEMKEVRCPHSQPPIYDTIRRM